MAKRLGAKIMQVSPGYLSTVQAVQVGRTLSADEVANATIHICPQQFGREAKSKPPFPSDPHQDAKAWDFLRGAKGLGARRVLECSRAGAVLGHVRCAPIATISSLT